MRVAVLCNDRIALPALEQLMAAKLVVGIGMSHMENTAHALVKARSAQCKIPFQLFGKKDLSEQLLAWLEKNKPDVVLVKTFPYLIPADLLSIPKYGFINFHYAPLPQWRGPNPLFWMIRNRETGGGVSVHRMDVSFDSGPILLQQSVTCPADVNFGFYYTQLAYVGAHLTAPLLYGLVSGNLKETAQDHDQAKWYRRPLPSDLFIDWNTMEAEEITALIRACNPWNHGAATRWNQWTFGITHATLKENNKEKTAEPGTVLSIDDQNGFSIACRNEKLLQAEVVYCEEGYYPGYCLERFGLVKNVRLS
jgi:methionyl-tRNA formyltransferase